MEVSYIYLYYLIKSNCIQSNPIQQQQKFILLEEAWHIVN